jgi:hypothetical protein
MPAMLAILIAWRSMGRAGILPIRLGAVWAGGSRVAAEVSIGAGRIPYGVKVWA